MIQQFLNGGPFMVALLILLISIIILAVKRPNQPHPIMVLGVISVLLGIGATSLGINAGIGAMPDISKVAPHILLNGIKTGLITTYFGAIILIIATAFWAYLIRK